MAKGETTERDYRKPCTLCSKPRDVLVRCQIDETGTWHFVCPGSCWKKVSGGIIDGDHNTEHEHYRYGGMWKNKHDAVSAKKPKKSKAKKSTGTAGQVEDVGASTADDTVDEGSDREVEAQHGQDSAIEAWSSAGIQYTRNDKVQWEDQIWICRRSHTSDEHWTPAKAYSLWKTNS